MTLKDRLNTALNETAPENTHRLDTLRAALNAGETDAEIEAALIRLLEAREQKAVALEKSGQPDAASTERVEIAMLQRLLVDPQPGQSDLSGKSSAKKSAKRGGPLISRTQMILGAVAAIVVVVALVVLLNPFGGDEDMATPAGQAITVFKDDHTLGNPKAPITLLEYAAPTCPHCAHFENEDFPELKREFIDTGKVFYIFRVFPLNAVDGAVEGIARCLPPDRYFPYIKMMFREQAQWDPDGYRIPDVGAAIIKLAASEGVSPEKAKQCMTDSQQQERLNQQAQDAQLRYQIEGTPTFVMNGQVVNIPPGQTAIDVLRLRINSLLSNTNQ